MASAVKRNTSASFGNVAHDMGRFGGNAAPSRHSDRGPQLQELPLVKPRKRSREQIQTRVKVNLRPKEEYSFLPAVGFLAAAFMAVMIIMGYSQLNTIYAQTVEARDELAVLQEEETTLKARYEEVFDQAALEAAVASAGQDLSEIRGDQKIYVDLSEPDNAVVYDSAEENALIRGLKELWEALTA